MLLQPFRTLCTLEDAETKWQDDAVVFAWARITAISSALQLCQFTDSVASDTSSRLYISVAIATHFLRVVY